MSDYCVSMTRKSFCVCVFSQACEHYSMACAHGFIRLTKLILIFRKGILIMRTKRDTHEISLGDKTGKKSV